VLGLRFFLSRQLFEMKIIIIKGWAQKWEAFNNATPTRIPQHKQLLRFFFLFFSGKPECMNELIREQRQSAKRQQSADASSARLTGWHRHHQQTAKQHTKRKKQLH